MADQRAQELLRELRGRYGVRLVREPPTAFLQWVAQRYLDKEIWANKQDLILIKKWLLELGIPVARCKSMHHSGERCERVTRHGGKHATKKHSWGV